MDLFDLIMNELSSTTSTKDKKFQKMKPNKGEHRYKDNRLGVNVDDNAILVFSEKEDDLKFAKRVSNFYEREFKVFEHQNAPYNGRYECKIYV